MGPNEAQYPIGNILLSLRYLFFFISSDSGIEDENGVVAEVVTNGQAEQIKAVISRQPTTKTEVNLFNFGLFRKLRPSPYVHFLTILMN